MDGVRNTVGDCDFWCGDQDSQPAPATKMDGRVVFSNGVDVAVYIAGNDTEYPAAGAVVYIGGWIVIHGWGDILPLAAIKIFTCDMAPVCDWRDGVLFLCGAVWRDT